MRAPIILLALAIHAGCSADARTPARFDRGVTVRIIDGTPSCPQCEIIMREVARLGHGSDPASIAEDALTTPCAVTRLDGGDYAVGGIVGGGQVLVYGETGRARHAIGRQGRGPGEFGRDLRVIAGRGDTLHVLDNTNYRLSSVTTSGEFVGSFRTPGRVHGHTLLAGNRFLLHARPLGPPEDDRALFHLLDASGAELARFGERSEALADLDQWVVSRAMPNGFWTASLWTYELYRWNGPDSLLWTLRREETPWFPRNQDLSPERFERMYESVTPPASLWHLYEEEGGPLWVYAWVPDADWEPGPIDGPTPEWTRDKLDTVIEVIDPGREARVITRYRDDRVLSPVCSSDLSFTVVYAESGDTRAIILRPELVGAPRGPAVGHTHVPALAIGAR